MSGRCPACGESGARALFRATDRLYLTTQKEFAIAECNACGLLRLEPRPSPEELAGYYPGNYWFFPEEDAASRVEEAYRALVLRDHVRFAVRALAGCREKGPVMDVGCGGGLFLKQLRSHGYRGVGFDNSLAAAAIAWKANRVPAMCGDLENAPLQRGSLAAITMFHVLEHVHDPMAYLRAAWDLLAADGRLIVQVPNADSWQFRLFGKRWNGIDVPRHLANYRRRDLENILERCGFEVLRCKHFSLRDNPAGFASSVAPSLDPMARRVRGVRESLIIRLGKDLGYAGLVLLGLPFAALEAACGAGSTIMIEARKRA